MSATFDKYYDLYLEAVAACADRDIKIVRRYELYYGTASALDFSNPTNKYLTKKQLALRKMCFELIEAQVDTSIPLAKITPRYAEDALRAADLEEYLNLEADRLNSEDINDVAERETRIQGTGIYHIGWDELAGNRRRKGDLYLEFIKLGDFYPQPYIESPDELEYVFVHKTTTVQKIKQVYGKTVAPDGGTKTSVDIVICWYLNDDGDVSKLVWTRQLNEILLDIPNYFARKVKVCSKCGEPWAPKQEKCPICGNTTSKRIDLEATELSEDLMISETGNPPTPPRLYLAQGTPIEIYRIRKLPFVIRHNIAQAGGSLYGVSDVDLLEEAQDAGNKILLKMAENVMMGGTIVTLPANTTIDNAAGSLKKVRLQDPRQKNLIGVYGMQSTVQQDDIMQDRTYQIGRQSVGVTDAYQGKRDPTAESGKAKEISAMQTAGRLESKYVDKTSAYSKLYQKMFEFLLAFSDEKRRIVKPYVGLENVTEATFSKYNFVVATNANSGYFTDDFIFSTNGSYTLSNKKESLWQATTQSFMAGAFGNPQDPRVVFIYWNIMNRYQYPLASKVLQFLEANINRLPPELEQALLANPELIQQLMALIQAKQNIAKNKFDSETQKNQEILDPTAQPLIDSKTTDDLKGTKPAESKQGGKA
ncbi:MAG: hypothetical protein M0R51_15295 [Clostridia bacterium]|jgi:hypothetical protein|nr:hypothetical protein [Clostridia bacterium]